MVSIIIPCYRQAHLLGEAIESALNQTTAAEVIVVDDGSPDDVPAVCDRYPQVKYIRQSNQGLGAARNAGVLAAAGEFLVFLDADDILLPTAVQDGLECIQRNPDTVLAYGRGELVTNGQSAYPEHYPRQAGAYEDLLRQNFIWMINFAITRRSAFKEVGGFDSSLEAGEDYDLYLRLARAGEFCRHDNIVGQYRRTSDSMSEDPGRMLRAFARIFERQMPIVQRSNKLKSAMRSGRRRWRDAHYQRLLRQTWFQLRPMGRRGASLSSLALLVKYAIPVSTLALGRTIARSLRSRA